jgi:O-acetylhomoserine (thiol)-lyase
MVYDEVRPACQQKTKNFQYGRKDMSKDTPQGFDTLAIHAGTPPDPATGARVTPIHQSAAFVFQDNEQAADLFALRQAGFVYSRLTNPTVAALEGRLAALDGGTGATCAASGHAAQLMVLSALIKSGEHVVAANKLYGGSLNQFKNTFPHAFGWNCTFADPMDNDSFKKALTEKTKCIFVESLANPSGVVTDLEAVARIAEEAGIPFIVDNTMATPYLCQPKQYGADVVSYSTTKFLSGHGHAVGGAIVDCGTFDWGKHAQKYPLLGGEEPGYHGLNFAETFGNMALAIHNHAVGLRDLGMTQQPMNAFLTLVGIETLSLRMERHCKNAKRVAEHLNAHPSVSWVNYTGLLDNPCHDRANKYMKGHGGAVFTFGVKGGYDAGVKLVNNVKLFSHLANIGDTRSLIIHPASTTHSQLSEEELVNANAAPDSVRLSIGIESIDDIIADLDQALAA